MSTLTPDRLALFDLDHTLLPLDSDYHWADFLARSGRIGDPEAALRRNDELMDRYNAGILTAAETYDFMLGLLTHGSLEELQAWHAEYMDAVVHPAIETVALELVEKHQSQGDLCAIVTATNEFVTRPIADAFNISHLVATTPEFADGRYTGRVWGTPSYQAGKIKRVQDWLATLGKRLEDFDETWFYSDSINDLPLMQIVSHPVATNPSPALRDIAIENDWPILDLFLQLQDSKS